MEKIRTIILSREDEVSKVVTRLALPWIKLGAAIPNFSMLEVARSLKSNKMSETELASILSKGIKLEDRSLEAVLTKNSRGKSRIAVALLENDNSVKQKT